MTEGLRLAAAGIPPGWLMVLGALALPLLRGNLRQLAMLVLTGVSFLQICLIPEGSHFGIEYLSYSLEFARVDALARVFGIVFTLAAFLAVIYAMKVEDAVQNVASLVYAGSAIAAVFAGDLITLFVCWELTAVSSVFLVWARGTEAANRAGFRYLVVQITSGLLLLAGAILHFEETGSLSFGPLGLETSGGWLIFLAFGIKAAFPLLHNWLQDAYTNATVTGTVFLSAFTTKLAIYALARGYAGTEILIPIGAVMTAFPIFYAVIENDLRRVLAYSLNNQLGFMVVGIGIGTELALNGTVAHAFAHVLYKSLLFMSMGAVLLRTGTANGSDLGGLYKSMPWTTAFCIVGAASISAFPLTSGFVSKSMILSAAGGGGYTKTFLVLLFASAGVLHYSGIRVPFFAFFARDSGKRVPEAPLNMRIAMGATAFLCIAIGCMPGPLYDLLPYPVDYVPYTTSHVVTVLQLLLFSALAFTFLMKTGLYPPELHSTVLDFDWVYRRALPTLGHQLTHAWEGCLEFFRVRRWRLLRRTLDFLDASHNRGLFGEPWPSGVTTLWAVLLLVAYLLLYY